MLEKFGMSDLDHRDRRLVDKIYKEEGMGLCGRDIDLFHKRLMDNVNSRSKKYKKLLENYKEETLRLMKEFVKVKEKILQDF